MRRIVALSVLLLVCSVRSDTLAAAEAQHQRAVGAEEASAHLGVARWFAERSGGSLQLSVLTLGELRKSIDAMPEGDRKASFVAGLETDLPEYFAGRILDIDSLLAATAMVHGLTLVTGNLADFSLPALRIVNPWDEPSGQG